MLRRFLLSSLLLLNVRPLLAETLADVLHRTIPQDPLPPGDVELPITSYAMLNDASYFAIAYYLLSSSHSNALEPPLRVLLFDKHDRNWIGQEFDNSQTKASVLKARCLGSAMDFERSAKWFLIVLHLSPSATCTVVLSRDLKLTHTLYGWPVASFSSGRIVFQRSEIHFAATHPLELALYDPARGKEVPLLPRKVDRIWQDLVEDVRSTADQNWCREKNASCDPEKISGTLDSINLNNLSQAAAFRVIYDSSGYGPKTENFVGEADVIYIFKFSSSNVSHREFRRDVLQKQFGTADLEKLVEPDELRLIFAGK